MHEKLLLEKLLVMLILVISVKNCYTVLFCIGVAAAPSILLAGAVSKIVSAPPDGVIPVFENIGVNRAGPKRAGPGRAGPGRAGPNDFIIC